MKIFRTLIFVCLLLSLVMGGNARKRTSSKIRRRPYRSTTAGYKQKIYSQYFTSTTTTPRPQTSSSESSSLIAKQVKDVQEIQCYKHREIFADPLYSHIYKICIPFGRHWVIYSYFCPNGTIFSARHKKCIVGERATTTSPTTKTPNVTKLPAKSTTVPYKPTTVKVTNAIYSDSESTTRKEDINSTDMYSSSEEEDNLTVPPEIDANNSKSNFNTLLIENQLHKHANLINDLLHRPNKPKPVPFDKDQQMKLKNKFRPIVSGDGALNEVIHQSTTKSELISPLFSGTSSTGQETNYHQFSTWSHHTESTSKPLRGYVMGNSVTDATNSWDWDPTKNAIRWKPTATTSYPGRFPGRRPSSN